MNNHAEKISIDTLPSTSITGSLFHPPEKNEHHEIITRRYDIDWLRSIAFILLIFYHIGMYYVADWQWHVKSAFQSDALKHLMLIVNPWRMPLIFLLSGMALSLVEPKMSWRRLFKMRLLRVFFPLLIGMYLIVPPQLYIELMSKEGLSASYLEFMRFYVTITTERYTNHQHGSLGLLTWNHLWYLAYLWCYTLVYLGLKPALTHIHWGKRPGKYSPALLFFILVCALAVYKILLAPNYPQNYALAGDWYSHALYFTIFLAGYTLAKQKSTWDKIIRYRSGFAALAITHALPFLALANGSVGNWLRHSGMNNEQAMTLIAHHLFMPWVSSVYTLACIMSAVAYAGAYLNKPSKSLRYMNEAILPCYILHQTVIIILTAALSCLSLGPIMEPLIMIALTFAICATLYPLIKRNNITRFIFGMKLESVST